MFIYSLIKIIKKINKMKTEDVLDGNFIALRTR